MGGTSAANKVIERRATACRICAVGCGTLVDVDVATAGGPGHRRSRRPVVVRLHVREGPRRGRRSTTTRTASTSRSCAATASCRRARGTTPSTTSPPALAAIVAEHGPEAVADYVGTGGPLDPSGYALADGLLPRPRHRPALQRAEHRLLGQVARAAARGRRAAACSSPTSSAPSLLLAIGVNTVVSHGHGRDGRRTRSVHLRDAAAPAAARSS